MTVLQTQYMLESPDNLKLPRNGKFTFRAYVNAANEYISNAGPSDWRQQVG